MAKRTVHKYSGAERRARRNRYRLKRTQGHVDRQRVRLSVFRSNCHIYAQVIDDRVGHTLASASSLEQRGESGGNATRARATEIGKLLAERARQAGVTTVVFDRGGYRYHGQVSALADGAREGGLEF